jgi:hypothetical protein
MKYIISENRLNDAIYQYINDRYPDLQPYQIDDNTYILFYNGNYHYGDLVLRYYYESKLLVFYKMEDYDLLTGYFEDIWKPIFAEWFYKRYELSVRKIISVYDY